VAPAQQARQAVCALECVLEIMVAGIHCLVIPMVAAEAIYGPAKKPPHERGIGIGKHCEKGSLDLSLYGGRISGDDR